MKTSKILIFLIFSFVINFVFARERDFVVVVHGGAGSYKRDEINFEKEMSIKEGLLVSLKRAYVTLKANGKALDAVQNALVELENNPLFNAGKGGKIAQNFEVELDASIMDGENLKCGAVAGVKRIKNPIKSAYKVMTDTPHILLVGEEADKFAETKGIEMVENSYFFTKDRIDEWIKAHDKHSEYIQYLNYLKDNKNKKNLKGTTGAVALDLKGNLAAATSTGGITYKLPGRVGDSPIIGAGNYANNNSIAISCTGNGEEMIRRSTAFDLHARYVYKSLSLKQASEEIMETFEPDTGGFISIDKYGAISFPFNTSGMARGYVSNDGIAHVIIFAEGEDTTPITYDIEKFQISELK